MTAGNIVIVAARPEHVDHVRGRLRRQDQDEVLAATGMEPDDALQRSFRHSSVTWAAELQGRAVALFGAGASGISRVGNPWLLGTDMLGRAGRAFVQHSRQYVQCLLRHFPVLVNVVDARNVLSLRWLRWCGFTIEPPGPFGPFRLPFHVFHMGGSHVHYRY